MSIFTLKIIACIFMVIDHVKWAIPETQNALTIYFGRIAFPLFAFMVVQGYLHTSNLKKYIGRLAIFAIVSEIPYMLMLKLIGEVTGEEKLGIDVIMTMLLGILAITCIDKIKNRFLGFFLATCLIVIGEVINVDYGWYGVGMIFLIYLLREKQILFAICYFLYVCLYYFIDYGIGTEIPLEAEIRLIGTTTLPLLFMFLYNGKLGPKLKYFFYVFYPGHMIILYLIHLIVEHKI